MTSQRALRSIGKLFRRQETFVIEFTGVVDDASFAHVGAIAELLRSVGGVDAGAAVPFGPTYVDEPTRSGDSAYVFVDAKHTEPDQVQGLVDIVMKGVADKNLGVGLPDGTRRFDDFASVGPVVTLSAYEGLDLILVTESAVPEVGPVVVSSVLEMVPDPEPVLVVGGIDVPSSRTQLLEQANHTGGGSLKFQAGVDGLSARATVSFAGRTRVIIAGDAVADSDRLAELSEQMRMLARELPGPPSAVAIRPDRLARDCPFGSAPNTLEDARSEMTNRVAGPDRAAIGIGWSQVMSESLWSRIAREDELITVVGVGDGRVEVTIGKPIDWAPWRHTTSTARTLANEMFEPVLLTQDQWRPIEVAHRNRAFAERDRR